MKLLIYSHYFPPSVGGVESIVLALASSLAAQRGDDGLCVFHVSLITQTPAHDFPDKLLPFRVIRRPTSSELRRLIREADVVHVAGPALSPILHAISLRKPVIVEHHGFQAICPTGQLFQQPDNIPCPGHFIAGNYSLCRRCSAHHTRGASLRPLFLTFVRRFLCKHIAVNITPTTWLASQLQLPRTTTVHHGLQPSPALTQLESAESPPLLAFVGRIVSTKGIHVLIEACQILQQQEQPFELVVIGDGPERTSLQEFVLDRKLSSQIHFLGLLPELEVAKVLARADCVVVPSLGGEVFGMVVLENMMRGIPVLASDLGAFVEVLGDCGFTFRTGDSAELAKQILQLLKSPALSVRLRTTAHQRAIELFDINRMIKGHEQIYWDLSSK